MPIAWRLARPTMLALPMSPGFSASWAWMRACSSAAFLAFSMASFMKVAAWEGWIVLPIGSRSGWEDEGVFGWGVGGVNEAQLLFPFLNLPCCCLHHLFDLELSQHARTLWGRPRDHFWLLFYLLKTGYPSLLYSWWFLGDLRVITKHFLREPKVKEELYPCPWEKGRTILVLISIIWLFPESSIPSTKWTISPISTSLFSYSSQTNFIPIFL